jgi:hypothetical protein
LTGSHPKPFTHCQPEEAFAKKHPIVRLKKSLLWKERFIESLEGESLFRKFLPGLMQEVLLAVIMFGTTRVLVQICNCVIAPDPMV